MIAARERQQAPNEQGEQGNGLAAHCREEEGGADSDKPGPGVTVQRDLVVFCTSCDLRLIARRFPQALAHDA
jgi:hypothetical protein